MSQLRAARKALRRLWRDFLSLYYANTYTWRVLKSGGLAFFGFFCWASANLLLSLQPGWTWLYFVMAYGFLLIIYGPFTHLVVVPMSIRLRRRPRGLLNSLSKKASKINITVFVVLVVVLAVYAPGLMVLDFGAFAGDTPDVDPQYACEPSDDEGVIRCTMTDEPGIGAVAVYTGDTELVRLEEPPYEWEVDAADLRESALGQLEMEIRVLDEDGNRLRTFRERFDPP